MIDPAILREQPDIVRRSVKERHLDIDVDEIVAADKTYRETLKKVEDLRHELKQSSASGPVDEAVREQLRARKQELKDVEATLETAQQRFDAMLRGLPNIHKDDVPMGKTEDDNEVVRTVGEPPKFDFEALDYLALAEKHDLIDLERAAKVSGSRFAYLKNEGAILSMALQRYAMDIAISEGFVPVLPPVLISAEAMEGMGYLEHGGADETYYFEKDNLYLVGTSEQSIGPMHMNEILEEADLPRRYVGFSSCFRREAGSYGKDTKGILRVHQFDKVEMFSITTPEKSDEEHEYLLVLQERYMKGLNLPYRVMKQSTGDMGLPSARTYDIETWVPSEDRYRETHSTSNTTDFQSRRLRIRYRTKDGQVKFVHMLNGTLTTNRPIITILENCQNADGSVTMPEILHPYLFGKTKIG